MRAKVPRLEVIRGPADSEEILIERMRGRRNVMIYMAYVSRQVLAALPELKAIAYLSTGLATHADMDAVRQSGVRLEGVKGYGDRAVAEHAIALAFAGLRRIVASDSSVREGEFRPGLAREFRGSVFGLLGLGGIGAETARLAHALGARTVAWTRSGRMRDLPVEPVSREAVFALSDVVSLHLALTPETVGIVGRESLRRMKPNAVLINTARGGILDEGALIEALRSKRIGHAALDVFGEEPLPAGHPFVELDNVTLSPHSAWMTEGAMDRLLEAGLDLLGRQIAETR